ncbi:MAG: Lipopolysaccharide export system ATP-binding protein LptB [Firmicutes bacterium ADurb.Bin182]|nr:MAG: Lipopolysaccharide export system ATP-binding protein LptB [Firmicutes bacterium ADurb.Bin182]
MLETNNVTINFGGLIAVNNVSIKVQPHKITALIGPNGAGKTTLFNCISGVYKPTSGEVILDGQHLEGKRGFQINAAGIARTYQVINLFWKMSVLENVLVGMNSRLKASFWDSLLSTKKKREEERRIHERAHELLQFVHLDEYADAPAASLSYGKQRLLEIVRGLASDPKVILLDEPAAGMNTAEKAELDILLNKIIEMGVTILVVEHDMKLIMDVSDYIYVLCNGMLLAEGDPDKIQKNPEVIAAYLGGDE